MTRRSGSYHHGDLKAALLDEAATMIAESGVDAVTMREIGRRVGVSRAAPYRHFRDKGALLVAVAAAGFDSLNARLRSVGAGSPGGSLESFRRMGEEYVRFAIDNPAHYRLMYGREAVARQDVPKLQESANDLFEHLVEVFEAYQRDGKIERQDPRKQAYIAWSAVHGLAALLIDGQIRAPVDVDALIRQTTATLLDGMRAQRGPAAR